MIHKLWVIHRRGGAKFAPSEIQKGRWTSWQTCLRKILIGHSDYSIQPSLLISDDLFFGKEAYQFLLEVASGLHSPLLGETEVFGQFRKMVLELEDVLSPWGLDVKRHLKDIISDVKLIRHKYLVGIGSHSYGSLARRHVGVSGDIHLIGSGIFIKDLLPWFLKRQGRVVVHCRSIKKAQQLVSKLPGHTGRVEIQALYESCSRDLKGAVIVAAPICTKKMSAWVSGSQINQILDLRGESEGNPIQTTVPTLPLSSLFQEISQQREVCLQRVNQAKEYIAYISNEKYLATQFRPYGWEDLCV